MSSETRKYELKARAESQRETRARIARAAVELHEEKGVSQTTVAEIARRAAVSRLTVYNHFADLSELLPACSAHYGTLHPTPEFGPALEPKDPAARAREVLGLLYGWYREVEPMFAKLLSDRASVPELDKFLSEGIDRLQRDLADAISVGFGGRGRRGRRALAGLATDFWSWRRLNLEGFTDRAAAGLMADAIAEF